MSIVGMLAVIFGNIIFSRVFAICDNKDMGQ
jgi:hypothetical protein